MSEEQATPTARAELMYWADKTATKLLCNAILRWIIRCLRWIGFTSLVEQGSLRSTAIATIVLTVVLYVFTIAISKLFNPLVPLWNLGIVLASFLSAFALGIVKHLHDSILPPGKNNFAEQIILAVREQDDNAYIGLRDWWNSFLNLWYQIPFVVVVGLLGMGVLLFFETKAGIDFHVGSYLLMFCCSVALGQGGYCALRIPILASVLGTMPMDLFWLNPASTPWIRRASTVFTKLSLANAFIGTCILVGFLLLRPWASPVTLAIALLLLLLTWAVVLYSFFYPHYQLGKVIKAEKSLHMMRLENMISSDAKKSRENGATESQIKGMYEIIRVYDQVASSQSSAINVQAVFGLLLSLGVPMLSFAVPLINIAKWVTEIAKPTSTGH